MATKKAVYISPEAVRWIELTTGNRWSEAINASIHQISTLVGPNIPERTEAEWLAMPLPTYIETLEQLAVYYVVQAINQNPSIPVATVIELLRNPSK